MTGPGPNDRARPLRFETALTLPDLEFTATCPVSPPNPMTGLIEKLALETVASLPGGNGVR